MTTDTLMTPTQTREYGVRYRLAGSLNHTVDRHAELWQAEEQLERLSGSGHVDIEIVTRVVTPWEISPEGLPATIRALAEARVDGEVDTPTVAQRLTGWLPRRDIPDMTQAWLDLLHEVDELRKAEDGQIDWAATEPEWRDPELLMKHLEALVEDAVRKVIGSAS